MLRRMKQIEMKRIVHDGAIVLYASDLNSSDVNAVNPFPSTQVQHLLDMYLDYTVCNPFSILIFEVGK